MTVFNRSNSNINRGFTLIEVIIVCAILGILAGVALPMLGPLRQEVIAKKIVDSGVGSLTDKELEIYAENKKTIDSKVAERKKEESGEEIAKPVDDVVNRERANLKTMALKKLNNKNEDSREVNQFPDEDTESLKAKARLKMKEETIFYRGNDGQDYEFIIIREECDPFGFYPGDRVNTPKGLATVIGVNGNKLWFHVDGDKGATHWGKFKAENFQSSNFNLVKSAR